MGDTAILNLLKSKPTNQRWAILVNEFGEIGVDGSLFEGQQSGEGSLFVRSVRLYVLCCWVTHASRLKPATGQGKRSIIDRAYRSWTSQRGIRGSM